MSDPGARALQRVRLECGQIVSALSGESGEGERHHDGIHAARKAIRRLRALLALVERSGLDVDAADRTLQGLGRGLSRARDAHVVVDATRQLHAKHPHTPWEAVEAALTARRARIVGQLLADDPDFARRRAIVEKVQAQLEQEPWSEVSARDIRAALKRSEKRVTKAAARAAASGDAEDIHRWRRRVRRLRMQLDVLPELLPKQKPSQAGHADSRAKALHKLSDRLGWQQDMQMLHHLVRAMPRTDEKPKLMAQIATELDGATD